MLKINKEIGMTILFVEQNLDMIMAMAQRCYVMDKGRIVPSCRPPALADRDVVKRHLPI